ncbi:hypothetical protein [Sphingomonas humi]|uniref:Uncharacterized protein n=1 Tax=Sphingomonas humi TaxID=335630 RepID=A0ABP7RH03_9SPHN
MSVELPVSQSLQDAHRHAVAELNRWRGHCIETLARLEEAATLTIAALPLPPGEKQPTVFGARMKVLKTVLQGCPHKKAPQLISDLDELQSDLNWRNRIVHAASSVYVDKQGGWIWHYRFRPSKAGAALEAGVLDQKTAIALENRLSSRVQSLMRRLDDVRADAAQSKPTQTPTGQPSH